VAAGGRRPGTDHLLVVFVAVFYFLLIRPQQKRMKDQQAMLSRLSTGDEVVTGGGILGRIIEVGDPFITLEMPREFASRSEIAGLAADAKGISRAPEGA